MNANPSRNQGPSLPVDSVSWIDADEFCTRLGWVMGATVRLPTEEEFRAARREGGDPAPDDRSRRPGYRDLAGNLSEWLAAPAQGEAAPVCGGGRSDSADVAAKSPPETRPKADRARHIGFRFILQLPPAS